jgi:protease I
MALNNQNYEVPKQELEKAGAITTTISLKVGEVKAWSNKNWGKSVKVDLTVEEADCDDFDALVLPGGVMNPDTLRQNEMALDFVRNFFDDGKPVAAICHGPWTLIDAEVVDGRRMTSYRSLKTDLENAGAEWSDESVVVDNGLVTSRVPADLPDFCRKMIEEIAEGIH